MTMSTDFQERILKTLRGTAGEAAAPIIISLFARALSEVDNLLSGITSPEPPAKTGIDTEWLLDDLRSLHGEHAHDWRISPHNRKYGPDGFFHVVCAQEDCNVHFRIDSPVYPEKARAKVEWPKYEGPIPA